MASFVVAALIAVLVLPSALNIPQSNPTEVVEFAPVPPEEDALPQDGSLSELGLGTTSSLTTGADADVPLPPPLGAVGRGERPVSKRCVGDPPRQTEDPNSPPCVPFFEGNNGGATWQGVTEDEVTILLYVQGYQRTNGTASPGGGTYCDVDGKPPDSVEECFESQRQLGDHEMLTVARAMSAYFRERFQLYDRKPHLWVYYSSASSASGRRADAHDNWETLKPFAVVDYAFFGGFNDIYADAMAKRRVSVYGNFGTIRNDFYRRNAPYVWSFFPDVEHAVENYVSYVCQKVAPHPNVLHGRQNPGGPRRYALMRYGGNEHEGLRFFGELAAKSLRAGCPSGARLNIVDEVLFPRHQFTIDAHPEARPAAQQNVASMMAEQVTTVLWLGGFEAQHSQIAFEQGWFPEWVLAGDGLNDSTNFARAQQQEVWRHAWVASNQLRVDRSEDEPCRMSFREARPRGTELEEDLYCDVYRPFFMLFRGVQLSGPRLTPFTVEQGNSAISPKASTDPYTAACFFDTNDYSCVKDAIEIWWNSDAPDPNGNVEDMGCYRMVRGGSRFLAWEWEGDGTEVFSTTSHQCNNYQGGAGFIGTP